MTADPFRAMASTLTQQARPAPPDDEHDPGVDDAVLCLQQHFEQHGGLPFPAGPMLPSQYPGGPPLLDQDWQPGHRAAAALLALRELPGALERADEVKRNASSFTGMVRYVIAEWVSHQVASPARGVAGDTAQALPALPLLGPHQAYRPVLLAFEQLFADTPLAQSAPGLDDSVNNHVRALIGRIDTHIGKDGSSKGRSMAQAFSALAYGCNWGGPVSPAAAGDPSPRPLLSEPQQAAVRAALDRPLGEWQLLAALFIKLVQGHGAYVLAGSGRRSSAHEVFFPVLQRVLDAMARQTQSALAPVAAGICRVLRDVADGDVIGQLPAGQPECFDRATLHPVAAMLAQARRVLGDPALNGCAEFEHWAELTASLTREVASVLTDPLLAGCVGLSAESFASLKAHLESWKKNGAEGRIATKAPDPAYRVFDLMPRLQRLFSCYGWMGLHGVKAFDKAFVTLASVGIEQPMALAKRPAAVHGGLGRALA